MWLVAGWDEVMWLLTRWDDGMSCHLASGGECDEMWCEGIGWDAVVMRCGCVLRWVGRWCAVMTLPRKYAPAKYRARHEKWHSNFTKYSQRVTLEFLWLFLPVALPFCDVCFLYCCSCLPNSPDFLIFLDIFKSPYLGSFRAKLPLFHIFQSRVIELDVGKIVGDLDVAGWKTCWPLHSKLEYWLVTSCESIWHLRKRYQKIWMVQELKSQRDLQKLCVFFKLHLTSALAQSPPTFEDQVNNLFQVSSWRIHFSRCLALFKSIYAFLNLYVGYIYVRFISFLFPLQNGRGPPLYQTNFLQRVLFVYTTCASWTFHFVEDYLLWLLLLVECRFFIV